MNGASSQRTLVESSSHDDGLDFLTMGRTVIRSSHDGWIFTRGWLDRHLATWWLDFAHDERWRLHHLTMAGSSCDAWVNIQSNMVESSHDDGWVFNRTWLNHLTTMVGYSIEHGWIISRRWLDIQSNMVESSHDDGWTFSRRQFWINKNRWMIISRWLDFLTMKIG